MVVTQELRADVAVIAGAILALVTALLWWRARRILARVVHGEGRITHFKSEETKQWKGEGQGSETTIDYLPHVEFALPDGTRMTFQSRSRKSGQETQGLMVPIVYDPLAPGSWAEIAGRPAWFRAWGSVLATGGTALAALAWGAAGAPL